MGRAKGANLSPITDLSGKEIGRLTVRWPVGYDKIHYNQKVMWLCSCSCGNTKLVPTIRLLQKNPTRSCGCLTQEVVTARNKLSLENLMGLTFKRLTVVGQRVVEGENYWVCQCSCALGTTIDVKGTHLRRGVVGSCGCLKRDSMVTHGQASRRAVTPEYKSYYNMLDRCRRPSCKSYSDYGGRGIRVCDRWLGTDGFTRFFEDMGEKPEPKSKYSLDRTNVEGNYEPSNCQWETAKVQAFNQRRNIALLNVTRLEKASGMSIDELIEFYENKPIIY